MTIGFITRQQTYEDVYDTSDLHLLFPSGIHDAHSMVIFDWASGVVLATAKIGHADIHHLRFNNYLWMTSESFAGGQGAAGWGSPRSHDSPEQAALDGPRSWLVWICKLIIYFLCDKGCELQ